MGALKEWVKQDWVRNGTDGKIKGKCGTSKNKKNPDRCLPKAKAQSLSKAQRAATARKKKKAGAKGKTVVKNTKKATVKKEGLWANINAKKKAGKKSSHKNSNAYKAAKKAGNALKQEGYYDDYKPKHFDICPGAEALRKRVLGGEFGEQEPVVVGKWTELHDELFAIEKLAIKKNFAQDAHVRMANERRDEIIHLSRDMNIPEEAIGYLKGHVDKIIDIGKKSGNIKETKGAPKGHYFTKSGNLVKGRLTKDARERGARLSDPKDKQRSKIPKVTQYTETSDPQDGKAAPYGSGYKKVTKEDITNLVVGLMHEIKNEGTIEEKDDRCTRIAKSKYDTWPSAYASGAVVRCRKGDIWKGVKEDSLNELKCKHGSYFCPHDKVMKCRKGPKKSRK